MDLNPGSDNPKPLEIEHQWYDEDRTGMVYQLWLKQCELIDRVNELERREHENRINDRNKFNALRAGHSD